MPRELDAQQLQLRHEVGRNIRRFRGERTLEDVGAAVGRDRRTVSAWEHGTASPALDDLSALGRALGVEPWRFLYG